ncbi:ABC transporter substrate-binding protein [Nakamurella sp. YIM 132087]|uniref:ABC transporter substrate-binding protein n=1 Tax=Nakamurella alba TaxID=2665158 RepID=A0A7K1FH12_9ACTN|nr:ABC transporter substrate-binding protein [Nakamurella alba]MTD13415.1 ABC transporter substrate-binding protein [Nakamurella alba]
MRWGAVVIAAMVGLTACGTGSSAESGGGASAAPATGLPSVVKVVATTPSTGVIAYAGVAANQGFEMAVKEINEQKFLGDTTIDLTLQDTQAKSQIAATFVSQAVANKEISAIFGAPEGSSAQAQAPVAQQGKIPIIFTQAGVPGVVIGDYTHRMNPLMGSYYQAIGKYLKDSGWKSIGIIYTAASASIVEVGENVLPKLAADAGMTVTGSVTTQATTQDFSAPISQILGGNPDGVAILLTGAQNATAMTQLRQAGYTGEVVGNPAATDTLAPAGEAGAGMVWPIEYNWAEKSEANQKFVKDFDAAYGRSNPLHNSAEAYDAMWMFAKALKAANSADRQAIENAILELEKTPWSGVLGSDIPWVDHSLEIPGLVVKWNGTSDEILYTAAEAAGK